MRFVVVSAVAVSARVATADVTKPFPGVTLVRDPGPTATAIVELCADGVSIRASKFGERDQRVKDWGALVGAELAINADFFEFPGWSWVIGRARGAGEDWPSGAQQHELTLPNPEHRGVWEFGPRFIGHRMDDIAAPAPGITDIVSGHNTIILNGAFRDDGDAIIHNSEHRTGVGVSADRRVLFLTVTANATNGQGLASLMMQAAQEAGAPAVDLAANMDSGGSSQFYARDLGALVDSTRPVGNMLGIFAKGTGGISSCIMPLAGSSGEVVARNVNRLDVVMRGADLTPTHKAWDGARWLDWQPMSGPALSGSPSTAAWGPNRLDAFARGGDGELVHGYWDSAQWHAWEKLGALVASSPKALSWAQDRLDTFARLEDGSVFHVAWDGAWHSDNIGGAIVGDPDAVSWGPNRIDVLARGSDMALWHKAWRGTGWTTWESIGGTLAGDPRTVSWASGRLDTFARVDDGSLLHAWWDGMTWTTENRGGALVGNPAVVAWDSNRLDVFGRGTDDALWHTSWNGSMWSAWESLGGSLACDPNAAAWGPNRLDVFAHARDGSLLHELWDGTQWASENFDSALAADCDQGSGGGAHDGSPSAHASGGCAAGTGASSVWSIFVVVALLVWRRRAAAILIAGAIAGLVTACNGAHSGQAPTDDALPPEVDAAMPAPGLASTPPMGWNTWYGMGCDNYNEQVLRDVTDSMVSSGLRDAGYHYVIIDDCWQVSRNAQGTIVADPAKFPSGMSALADYVHAHGLKLGIYTDVAQTTCQGRPGSLDHEELDASTYASWGIDFIKEDWCASAGLSAAVQYKKMKDAIADTGRPMVLNICNWGEQATSQWAPDIGQLWRTTADVGPAWEGIARNLDQSGRFAAIAHPNAWNDPDYLVAGLKAATDEEYKTQVTMWAIMAAPLVLSADVRHLDDTTSQMISNQEVIAIDQDVHGVQGTIVALDGAIQIWAKPLAGDGTRAVALYNPGTTAAAGKVLWSALGLADGSYPIRDPWGHQDLGSASSYMAMVPPHGAVLIVVAGTEAPPPHGEVQVSDLPWAYAASGWGPPERDRSNNLALYDGNPLRLRGQPYGKGIGAHAESRIRIRLGGRCQHFHAVVGIDDEVGPGHGSASFEVWADGQRRSVTPMVTSDSAGLTIETDLDGAQLLELVAHGGDNLDYDHVDWADARLSCAP